ncbi:MAG: hypothetical protein WBJ82_05010 [Tepidanaerobacteraceae bacterium]|nr:hypothetical protein [Tepidanaerobacter sp.]HQE06161.1 hypothetical protein [Tepidanaerobacteraceae bacterium]
MSPEQTIVVAKLCKTYKKGNTYRYPADYVTQYDTCKNCVNWQVGHCEKAQDILNSIY